METQTIRIAIVLLNWNGKKWLEKFLPALILFSKEADIFIVDNASEDDSVEYVKAKFPHINLILNSENNGYAKGYHDALTKIKADYFVLLNSDVEVTENWLNPIILLMEDNSSIAACQPKILDYNNRKQFEYAGASGGFIDYLGYPYCRGRIFDDIEKDTGQYDDVKEIFWASGACIFIRSIAYHEVGGLDEDFFAHQEEIDLCWRLKNRGYKIMVQPSSIVYHVGGGTLAVGSSFKTKLNFRNNLYMLFKNLPIYILLFLLPLRLLLDGLAAIIFITKPQGIKHVISIIQAHFEFYLMIPKLITKRSINKDTNNERYPFSIIYQNKILRKRRFLDL